MKKQHKLLIFSLTLLATGCYLEAGAFGTKGLADWLAFCCSREVSLFLLPVL